jgi:hypothetical protein
MIWGKKIIVYLKFEGFNLNSMTVALKLIVTCDFLVWQTISKLAILAMHFLRLVNML